MKEIKRASSGGFKFIFEIDSEFYPLYKYLMKESADIRTSRILLKILPAGRYTSVMLEDIAIELQKTFREQMEDLMVQLEAVVLFYAALYPKAPDTVKVLIKKTAKPMSAGLSGRKLAINIDFGHLVADSTEFFKLAYELGHYTKTNARLKIQLSKRLKLTNMLAVEKRHWNLLQPIGFSKYYNMLASFFTDHMIQKNAGAAFTAQADPKDIFPIYHTILDSTDNYVYKFLVLDRIKDTRSIYLSHVFVRMISQFFMPRFTGLLEAGAPELAKEFHGAWLERIYALSPSGIEDRSRSQFVSRRRRELANAIVISAKEPELLAKYLDELSKDLLEMDRRYAEILAKGIQRKEIKLKDNTIALQCFNEHGIGMIADFITLFYERADHWLKIDQAEFKTDMMRFAKSKSGFFVELAKAARHINAMAARLSFPKIERF